MTQKHWHIVLAPALFLLLSSAPALAAGDAAQAAFDKLKGLAGTWHGEAAGEGEAESEGPARATHIFQVSAAGTVVMQTMDPGGDHEMINMYHLDGDDLMLTHYCAGGNQPRMKLVEGSADELRFDFVDGTNLDAGTDMHIHSSRLEIVDADHIQSDWTAYAGGKETGIMKFALKRDM